MCGGGVGLLSDKRVWQVDTFKSAQAAQRRLEFRREQLRRDAVRRGVETMGFFRAQPRAGNLRIHPPPICFTFDNSPFSLCRARLPPSPPN